MTTHHSRQATSDSEHEKKGGGAAIVVERHAERGREYVPLQKLEGSRSGGKMHEDEANRIAIRWWRVKKLDQAWVNLCSNVLRKKIMGMGTYYSERFGGMRRALSERRSSSQMDYSVRRPNTGRKDTIQGKERNRTNDKRQVNQKDMLFEEEEEDMEKDEKGHWQGFKANFKSEMMRAVSQTQKMKEDRMREKALMALGDHRASRAQSLAPKSDALKVSPTSKRKSEWKSYKEALFRGDSMSPQNRLLTSTAAEVIEQKARVRTALLSPPPPEPSSTTQKCSPDLSSRPAEEVKEQKARVRTALLSPSPSDPALRKKGIEVVRLPESRYSAQVKKREPAGVGDDPVEPQTRHELETAAAKRKKERGWIDLDAVRAREVEEAAIRETAKHVSSPFDGGATAKMVTRSKWRKSFFDVG